MEFMKYKAGIMAIDPDTMADGPRKSWVILKQLELYNTEKLGVTPGADFVPETQFAEVSDDEKISEHFLE